MIDQLINANKPIRLWCAMKTSFFGGWDGAKAKDDKQPQSSKQTKKNLFENPGWHKKQTNQRRKIEFDEVDRSKFSKNVQNYADLNVFRSSEMTECHWAGLDIPRKIIAHRKSSILINRCLHHRSRPINENTYNTFWFVVIRFCVCLCVCIVISMGCISSIWPHCKLKGTIYEWRR